MRSLFFYIAIIIVGIGLTQYQFVHRGKIMSVLSGTITNSHIYERLESFNEQLLSFSNKLLAADTNTSEKTNSDTPDETPIDMKKNTDRTILNAENILYFTNLERTKRELEPLKFSAKLTRSAGAKNKDMFTYQYFAHESPIDNKKGFTYFIDNESYEFVRVSENLAMGEFSTAESVVTAWMNSPTHRVNILYPDYQNIGVSVKTGTYQGGQVVMIVQHFGIPKNACPIVSSTTFKKLQTLEQEALESKKVAQDLEYQINTNADTMSDREVDSLIGMYNTTIKTYNALVSQFQDISEEYNEQVQKYDACIKKLNAQ